MLSRQLGLHAKLLAVLSLVCGLYHVLQSLLLLGHAGFNAEAIIQSYGRVFLFALHLPSGVLGLAVGSLFLAPSLLILRRRAFHPLFFYVAIPLALTSSGAFLFQWNSSLSADGAFVRLLLCMPQYVLGLAPVTYVFSAVPLLMIPSLVFWRRRNPGARLLRKRHWGLFLTLTILVLTFGAALILRSALERQEGPDRVVLRIGAKPVGLNPCITSGVPGNTIYGLYNDCLARRSLEDPNEWEPRLAESWEVTGGGENIVLHLREGVRWHDGKPLTAEDILFTWKAYADESLNLYQLSTYRNCTVEVIDADSVRFQWKYADYKNFANTAGFNVLPKHVLDYSNPKEFFEKIVRYKGPGTGPWKLRRVWPGETIVLERNNEYWGGPPMLSGIYVRVLPDKENAISQFIKGTLDVIELTPSEVAVARKKRKRAFNTYPLVSRTFGCVIWNCRKAPFDDEEFRRGMRYILNVQAFIQKALGGSAIPISGPCDLDSLSYDKEIAVPKKNLGLAIEHFRRAGLRMSERGELVKEDGSQVSFELLVGKDSESGVVFAEELRRSAKDCGIRVEVVSLPWGQFLRRWERRDFDALLGAYAHDWDHSLKPMWHSGGNGNASGISDGGLDALLEDAQETLDPEKRAALHRNIHRRLDELQPVMFTWRENRIVAVDSRFKGVHYSRFGTDFTKW